jgi:hypothetical protein
MEAMRLGFVERQQVPSARRYVEAHRERRYALTRLGREAAELAQDDIAVFCDRLAEALYKTHHISVHRSASLRRLRSHAQK